MVEVGYSKESLSFDQRGGSWRLGNRTPWTESPLPVSRIKIELRQDRNTPPALYATERATGRSKLIVDPNPDLAATFELGNVQDIYWSEDEGRNWSGVLYLPVRFVQGRRYPLLIQTHGYPPANAFSLYGYKSGGLGPGGAPFAAQPIANREIAVLQVQDVSDVTFSPKEGEVYMQGYEAQSRRQVPRQSRAC